MMLMMRRALFVIGLGAGVAASMALPSTAAAQRDQRTAIDTTFSFDKAGVVSISGGGSATVIVTGWDERNIRVRGRAEDGYLHFDASSKRVTISPSRSGDDAMIQISVPRGVQVVAHTNDGDITIRGTRGDVDASSSSGGIEVSDAAAVEVSTLSGDVDVAQATGAVTATSSSGDLTLRGCSGKVDATSSSGDLSISRSTSKTVSAITTNGEVTFDGTLVAQGSYSLTSHSGDVEVVLAKDASAQVGVGTWSGTIDTEVPVTIKSDAGSTRDMTKHFSFTLGGGSAKLTAESFSGDIVIRTRGG
jgi:DUF4097 and DUF4098 domain-containing protein YvlB